MYKTTRPKSKRGQILVFVLILMAIGLIVITPLLHFLDSSYTAYKSILIDTEAYYAADAMLNTIIADMVAGEDVVNRSANYTTHLSSGWLNGCNINTTISSALTSYPAPDTASDEWLYMDPGFSLEDPLAYGATHNFTVYLIEGSNITVHWNFDDRKDHWGLYGYCAYYCNGSMWITNSSGATVNGSASTVLWNGASTAFNQSLDWQVPTNGSGNYTIHFKNRARAEKMDWVGGCEGPYDRDISLKDGDDTTYDAARLHSIYDYACQTAFSGTGNLSYTWVKVGKIVENQVVQYRDYTITTTAKKGDSDVVSVTAVLRQTPGPLMWWATQNVEIVSWQVSYH